MLRPIHKNREFLEQKYRGRESARHTLRWYHKLAMRVFRLSFLRKPGLKNAANLRLNQVELHLENLPPEFNGCRILLITDIHTDGIPDVVERIVRLVEGVDYDYCFLGGDYSFDLNGGDERVRQHVDEVVRYLVKKSRVFGILGNHDIYRTAELLDELGVEMLLNESVCIERNEKKIYLVGVDDCIFFNAAEVEQAGADVPSDAFKIILSHSPDLYKQAAQIGYSLYLSGHTHGGQICLPGGIALTSDAHVPRRLVKGKWEYKGMVGYTSYGVGASIAPVRFFCRPEIALLVLTRADNTG